MYELCIKAAGKETGDEILSRERIEYAAAAPERRAMKRAKKSAERREKRAPEYEAREEQERAAKWGYGK